MSRSKTSLTEKTAIECTAPSCSAKKLSEISKDKQSKYEKNTNEIQENISGTSDSTSSHDYLHCNTPTMDSISEHDEGNEDNALERCKRNCEKGIFSIKELLEVCKKDPDSLLRAYRRNHTNDKDIPKMNEMCGKCEEDHKEFYSIRYTHGEKFGDPKYHYLMVDASTSIEFPIAKETDEEDYAKDQIGSDIHSLVMFKEKEEEIDKLPSTQPLTYEEDDKSIRKPSEDDDVKKIKNDVRTNSVTWKEIMAKPNTRMPMSDSIEKVVIKATAKADKFRHNVSIRKHFDLLSEVIREEKNKVQNSNHSVVSKQEPSVKRYFGLLKAKNKKEKETPEAQGGSKECFESDEYCPTVARKQSESLESYRRRSLSVENPVYEEKDKISKYLSNITR